jgi:cytochrome P450
VLRLFPAELFLRRVSTTEAEVEGVTIPAGAQVLISLPGANRDPAAFDEPDAFAPGRNIPHLSFGSGIHTCVGGPLNRKVTLAVLQELLAATRSFELDCPRHAVPFTAVMVAYAPRALPLRLELAS